MQFQELKQQLGNIPLHIRSGNLGWLQQAKFVYTATTLLTVTSKASCEACVCLI